MKRQLFLPLLLAGCSTARADWTSISADWKKMSFEQRQTALDSIANGCKLARSTFQLYRPDELRFQPDPSASYENVDCALGKLKIMRGFDEMGFIGNEAYTEDEK